MNEINIAVYIFISFNLALRIYTVLITIASKSPPTNLLSAQSHTYTGNVLGIFL